MKQEIRYYHFNPPNKYLELFGIWSFSLYLTHQISWIYWVKITHLQKPFYPWSYACSLLFILIVAYLYYYLCESPAHQFARAFGRSIEGMGKTREK
jgi:peptidoglycan/LPS O-acetylase OafA/YrhL